MRLKPLLSLLAGLAAAWTFGVVQARAEVIRKGDDFFILQIRAPLTAPPERALAGLGAIGQWWNAAHTYSGDAAKMSLPLQVGACLCEALADGGRFEHGRVVLIQPQRSLELEAPLGPLNGRTTRATLVFSWTPLSEDPTLVLSYWVEGEGVGAWAEAVDRVMQSQFDRWAAWVQPNVAQ